jgi:hypothetical protein
LTHHQNEIPSGVTISVICPTRNRAELWRSGWLLDSLSNQTRKPDELVIAVDHTEDDTLPQISQKLEHDRFPIPTRILTVDATRPEPFPASALPDNCTFHNCSSDIFLHVDDDIELPARFVEQTLAYFDTLPNISVWYPTTFVDQDRNPLPEGIDWRFAVAKTRRWPTIVAGLVQPVPSSSCATGAIFAALTSTIRQIGGHDVANLGHHNQDTLLGYRLSRACTGGTYLAMSQTTTALHLGLTWHMQHHKDPAALRTAYGQTRPGPTIANGGLEYWKSDFWKSAYTVSHTHTLTTPPRVLRYSRVMLRPDAKVKHHADPR